MLLQKSYTKDDIELLKKKGNVVVYAANMIDLADSYIRNGVRIDERISVDSKTRIPYSACFYYSDLPEEKRPIVLQAIEEAYENNCGFVFRSSPDPSPTIKVSILVEKGKQAEKTIEKAIEHLKKLEEIIQK